MSSSLHARNNQLEFVISILSLLIIKSSPPLCVTVQITNLSLWSPYTDRLKHLSPRISTSIHLGWQPKLGCVTLSVSLSVWWDEGWKHQHIVVPQKFLVRKSHLSCSSGKPEYGVRISKQMYKYFSYTKTINVICVFGMFCICI